MNPKRKRKNVLFVLIRKQLIQMFSFTKSKKSIDLAGLILYLFIIGSISYIFLAVFSRFAGIYGAVKVNGITDFPQRQYELMSIAYMVAFFMLTLSSINSINNTIFESDDLKILTALPISSAQLFWSKMISVYAKQVINAFIIITPINASFVIAQAQSATAYPPAIIEYALIGLLICLIFPMTAIATASLFATPVHYIKTFLSKRYWVVFILVTLFTLLGVYAYGLSVNSMKYLVIRGEMEFILNQKTLELIQKIASFCVPANLFASIMLKRNILLNLGIVFVAISVCISLSVFLINKILQMAIQNRLVMPTRPTKFYATKNKKSVFFALVAKEFNTIFRTPSYTFMYLSMALAMPVMTGLIVSMASSFLLDVIFSPVNFELALFITMLCSVLTNTFCATNISRDGASFFTAKALPISIKQIMLAKVALCAVVSILSVALSATILALFSYITPLQAIYIFATVSAISFAQICFATKLDFNHPRLASGNIKQSNTTVSTVIIVGLLFCAFFGFLTIYFAVYAGYKPALKTYDTLFKIFVCVLGFILAFVSERFIAFKLTERYYNFYGSFENE